MKKLVSVLAIVAVLSSFVVTLSAQDADPATAPYIGNSNSKKLHLATCQWGQKTRPSRKVYFQTYEEAIAQGYIPCKACKPDLTAAAPAAAVQPAAADAGCAASKSSAAPATAPFIGHKKSKKLHRSTCQWGQKMSERNRVYFNTYEEAIAQGYIPCKSCQPDLMAASSAAPAAPVTSSAAPAAAADPATAPFVGNSNSKKLHRSSCMWGQKTRPSRRVYFQTYEEAIAQGYVPCKTCKPDLTAAAPAAAVQPATSKSGCTAPAAPATAPFIGHKKSKKLHRSTCQWGQKMSERNRAYFNTYEEAIAAGYVPCKSCKPDLSAAATSVAPAAAPAAEAAAAPAKAESEYWASSKGKTFHRPSCEWAQRISEGNLVKYQTRDEAIAAGKKACKVCRP